MSGSLITKLQRFTELDKADRGALGRFEAEVRDFRAGSDVITQGTQPDRVHLLVQGWGCRYKLLPTGKRQIVAYLIPGDLCDVHVFVLRRMDHSIGVLGPAKVAVISPQLMLDTMDPGRRLRDASAAEPRLPRTRVGRERDFDAVERFARPSLGT